MADNGRISDIACSPRVRNLPRWLTSRPANYERAAVAKKRTLRTLSSEVPAPETVEQILLHLHTRQDREAAIVGASLVESALQERLLRSFDSAAEGLEQSLFENGGALSDFNSKILVAQAFAVIPNRLAEDMQRIRKIRNCFAHARIDVVFDDPLIAREVYDLAAVIAVQSSIEKYPNSYPANYTSAKTSFGLSCYITCSVLKSAAFPAVMRGAISRSPDITHGRESY